MPGPASVSDDGESSFTTGPAAEHTRLLQQSGGTMLVEYSPSLRAFRLWATLSFAAASLTLVLLLACWIVLKTIFDRSSTWDLDQGIPPLAFFTFLSLVISLARVRATRFSMTPQGISSVVSTIFALLIDGFLAMLILGGALNLVTYPQYQYDYWCRSDESDYISPIRDCRQWLMVLCVTLWIAIGFAAIVGLAHTVLALMSLFSMFQPNFWNRQLLLGVSTGELSFEVFFGVRAMRQPHIAPSEVDERTEGETEGGTTEAGTER